MRKSVIAAAVGSYFDLAGIIDKMTLAEVLHALEIESGAQRRKSTICRLIKRAVRLNEIAYRNKLIREHLNGETTICDI